MTYRDLINELSKHPEELLQRKVILFEGCSGNYDTITRVEIASEDMESEWTGKIAVKEGQLFICHDH